VPNTQAIEKLWFNLIPLVNYNKNVGKSDNFVQLLTPICIKKTSHYRRMPVLNTGFIQALYGSM